MNDNNEDDEDVSGGQFQIIQQNFERVLQRSKADPNFSAFHVEFENIFFELKNAFSEKNFTKSTASMDELKRDAEKAWDLVEVGRKKEKAISDTVNQLQDQLTLLSSQLEEERTSSLRRDDQFEATVKDRESFKAKVAELSERLHFEEKKTRDLTHWNQSLEEKNKDLREKNIKLMDDFSTSENKVKDKEKRCDQLEKDLVQTKEKLECKAKEFIDSQYSVALSKSKIDKLNEDLRGAETDLRKQASACNEVSQKAQDLSDALKAQNDQLQKKNLVLADSRKKLEALSSEHRKITTEKSQLQRKFDNEHKAVLRLQQSVENIKSMNNVSQQEVRTLQRELDTIKDNGNNVLRQKGVLEQEKNMQIDKIHRMEQIMKQADEDVWHQEQTILSLNKDLTSTKNEIGTLKKQVHHLNQLCEKQNNDITERQNSLEKANDQTNTLGIEIQEMKKEVGQWKRKLKDQEQLSNRIRAEQGKALRELLDEQNEKQKVKNQNSILSLDLGNLRNELLCKDETLVKTHFDIKKETTKKEQLNNEVSLFKRQLMDRDEVIQKQNSEMHRLNMTVKKMDENLIRQKKEYDQLINERDILSAQLIRRNDELALLYEKVKIQRITLNKGEMQYKERLEDLKHLKIKLQDVKRELNSVKNGNVDQSGLSKHLVQREKELLNEKVKVKALSEELQNPLNVHRWRKLEGSDPAKFELVQKNELLQKRLLQKTEEVIEKMAVIQEHEDQISLLKRKLERKPGTEVTDKLKMKENEIREKARQMKAMAGELNMNQVQVNEFKKEIDRLTKEVHELKHKLFEQKKKEVSMKEKELEWITESGIACFHDNLVNQNRKGSQNAQQPYHQKVRFVGGGFAVK